MRRSSDVAFAAVLAGAMLFVYRPLLSQPLLLDDVGLFHFLRAGRGLGAGASLALAFARCALPVYFRPLAAPVFWALERLWGAAPLGYRLLMLAAAWSSSLLVGRVAARLGGGGAAQRTAAALYALSWVQWSGLTLVAGLPQSLSDLLFWAALLAFLRGERPRLAPALALATAALLLKEHALVWPLFAAAAAGGTARLEGKRRTAFVLACAGWGAGYLLLRLALPGHDFAGAAYAPRLDPAAAARGAAVVLASLVQSWTAWPAHAGSPGEALAALALGAAGAFAVLAASPAPPRAPLSRALRFAAAGLAAGLLPYLFFPEALDADSVSRFSLAWGAAAVGLGAAIESALGLARAASPKLAAGVWLAAASLLFVRTAALFRHPDGGRRVFARWPLMAEARRLERALAPAAAAAAPGDVFVFSGFRAEDRAPWRLQLLAADGVQARADDAPAGPAAGRWSVALRAGASCVDVRPPTGAAWSACGEAP
ncbi:MAG TPA: hypothetical protein VN915_06275 [Elusimicrobiota bacterium]|nr:hypothetical protein [Elusimicrobiota bacterium]